MHHNVLCKHIFDKTKVFEVEASTEGAARIADSVFELGWCRQCSPLKDWGSQGACRQYPASWWLDPENDRKEVAKAICRRCPVQALCLAAAHPEDGAIAGGLSEHERSAS